MKDLLIFGTIAAIIILLFERREKTDKTDEKKETKLTNSGYPNPAGSNRGLKNNNPGNIRKSSDTFQGEILPSGDAAFKQFKTMQYGERAIFVVLNTYAKKYGRDTIKSIVERWAPANENNTDLYIEQVEKWSGINRNIKITNDEQKIKVVRAIIRKETSYIASETELKQALKMV